MAAPCSDTTVTDLSINTPAKFPVGCRLWRHFCAMLKWSSKAPVDDRLWAKALPNIVHLDAHILKDIGAPAWVAAQAQERRNAQSRCLTDLWRS